MNYQSKPFQANLNLDQQKSESKIQIYQTNYQTNQQIIKVKKFTIQQIKQMSIPENMADPNKYYNHGDNPAMKKFLQIAMENAKGSKYIDHRTYFIDNGQRLMMARNWDDFLQRDLKAYTFPRASVMMFLNTCVFYTVFTWVRHLIPIGRFGIRRISQTPFYQNFGVPGVAGAGLLLFGALYTEIKTAKFFLHKFYRHVIMQDRNWIHEGQQNSRFGDYYFKDNFLSNENYLFKSPEFKIITSLEEQVPTYTGPYQDPKQ